ncbi:hypothetical protein J5N97_004204 [Dioscorea zingiberensis]|uniref:Pentatricopeptide repeat-containing protein n=1 Tax=Dioscorea zingiberensis TaxID=325984 RepID=A0A9D5HR68_9LILI|nr:hypothetical protein J5N97_004204 [Dioscorea zingiberensis]
MSQGARDDPSTFFGLVSGCSDPKHLDHLKKLHDLFIRTPFRADLQINNKFIEMFSLCGSIQDACRMFDRMPDRNMDSWHLLIHGYGSNLQGDDGLQVFEQMQRVGVQPDGLAIDQEAKEQALLYHSERLAIAYDIEVRSMSSAVPPPLLLRPHSVSSQPSTNSSATLAPFILVLSVIGILLVFHVYLGKSLRVDIFGLGREETLLLSMEIMTWK